jgi:hypothetical protein
MNKIENVKAHLVVDHGVRGGGWELVENLETTAVKIGEGSKGN